MTRAEKVAEAQRLRAEGLKLREIAERMGAAVQTVGEWVADPDGAKHRARRMRYAGVCIDCGKPTDGSAGPGKAAKRCLSCDQHRNDERNTRILEAWDRGDSAPVIAAREGVTPPAVKGVVENTRRRKGLPVVLHRRVNRELWPLIERRWGEGASMRAIAAECGIAKENLGMMMLAMRRAGVALEYRYPPRSKAA